MISVAQADVKVTFFDEVNNCAFDYFERRLHVEAFLGGTRLLQHISLGVKCLCVYDTVYVSELIPTFRHIIDCVT